MDIFDVGHGLATLVEARLLIDESTLVTAVQEGFRVSAFRAESIESATLDASLALYKAHYATIIMMMQHVVNVNSEEEMRKVVLGPMP